MLDVDLVATELDRFAMDLLITHDANAHLFSYTQALLDHDDLFHARNDQDIALLTRRGRGVDERIDGYVLDLDPLARHGHFNHLFTAHYAPAHANLFDRCRLHRDGRALFDDWDVGDGVTLPYEITPASAQRVTTIVVVL